MSTLHLGYYCTGPNGLERYDNEADQVAAMGRYKLQNCAGVLPRPAWSGPLTPEETRVRDARRAQLADSTNHRAWEDFSMGWRFLGYAVTDPEWLQRYLADDWGWHEAPKVSATYGR